ncbi:MAG: hypothetical protein OQJ99_07500 [Rhodospirillales bacterium]|nr:hypothetical protein [Rhodospirillales bacterium]MCW8860915.1 hypothetical protein [Rhodospirillales bacterium]MCW8969973.1 hypothetical protein [Rhodospirillales bacterium]MCW9001438.1 hypothetical protein [Rhodospirillales bacterium]
MGKGQKRFTQKLVNGRIKVVPVESRAMSPAAVIMAFLALGILTLAIVLWFGFLGNLKQVKNAETEAENVAEIYAHKVRFGMGAEEVRDHYPSLLVAYDGRDRKAGTFLLKNARHTIWFIDDGRSGEQAYRINYEKVFHDLTEEEILTHLVMRYGRFVYDDCRQVISAGRPRCHYRWQGEDGASIDAYTRKVDVNGKPTLHLSIIATDTYLEAKVIRASIARNEPSIPPNGRF